MAYRGLMKRGVTSVASVAVALLSLGGSAGGATIEVTDTADDFFAAPGGTCSLREAVQAANDDADFGGCAREGGGAVDRILLEGGVTHTRSRAGADDTNDAGDLDITGETVIKALGEGKAVIDAVDIDRVLEIHPGATLIARRLSLQNGAADPAPASSNAGGGILNRGRLELTASIIFSNEIPVNMGCACGGGLASFGNAVLDRVLISQNIADLNFGGGIAHVSGRLRLRRSSVATNRAGSGGGIGLAGDDSARVRIERSTITENLALDTAAVGEFEWGGGIYVGSEAGASQRLTNVTISGNRAGADGGGIYLFSGAVRLNAATVTANEADADEDSSGDGGGVFANDGGVRLRNSILWGNIDPDAGSEDCVEVVSRGHNLFGQGTGCDPLSSDVTTLAAKLKPLGDYGGPTQTHALRKGSPAIGLAGPNSAPKRDQRGSKRDGNPDAGAFER